jgi:hypothetical protein
MIWIGQFNKFSLASGLPGRTWFKSKVDMWNNHWNESSTGRTVLNPRRELSYFTLTTLWLLAVSMGRKTGTQFFSGTGHLLAIPDTNWDFACRFGVEEFILALPDNFIEITRKRAERFERMSNP